LWKKSVVTGNNGRQRMLVFFGVSFKGSRGIVGEGCGDGERGVVRDAGDVIGSRPIDRESDVRDPGFGFGFGFGFTLTLYQGRRLEWA
jgi:hypothetical protein